MSEGFAIPPGPAPRVRPPAVTAATWLLLVVAVLLAASFVMAIATSGTVADVYEEAYAGTELEGSEGAAVAGLIGGAALNLLFAIGFVVLALLNHRGKNPARIVTWVLGGVALCCVGVGLALSGITANLQVDTNGGPDPAEVQRMVEDALPGWYTPASLAVTIGVLVGIAAALILLALPPSNRFFRKPEQPFEPPPAYPPVG